MHIYIYTYIHYVCNIHTYKHTYIYTHIHKYLCPIIKFWSRDLITKVLVLDRDLVAKVLVLVSRPGGQGLGLEVFSKVLITSLDSGVYGFLMISFCFSFAY